MAVTNWTEHDLRIIAARDGLDPDELLRGRRVPKRPTESTKKTRKSARPKRPPSGFNSEDEFHRAVVVELRDAGLRHMHVPLGGKRDPVEAAKFQALGTSAGWPDLHITTPTRLGYRGVVLELKHADNGPTPEQIAWLQALDADGYLVGVCWLMEEVRAFLEVCWPGRVAEAPSLAEAWVLVERCRAEAVGR